MQGICGCCSEAPNVKRTTAKKQRIVAGPRGPGRLEDEDGLASPAYPGALGPWGEFVQDGGSAVLMRNDCSVYGGRSDVGERHARKPSKPAAGRYSLAESRAPLCAETCVDCLAWCQLGSSWALLGRLDAGFSFAGGVREAAMAVRGLEMGSKWA